MKTLGILVVAGDFNNAVTINVIRQQLSELQLPGKFSLAELQTDEGMRKFQQGAEVGAATQANIFEFGILSSSIRVGQKNRLYCDLEYTNSICKSEILEGRGGRKRYADPLRAVNLHFIILLAVYLWHLRRFSSSTLSMYTDHMSQPLAGFIARCSSIPSFYRSS